MTVKNLYKLLEQKILPSLLFGISCLYTGDTAYAENGITKDYSNLESVVAIEKQTIPTVSIEGTSLTKDMSNENLNQEKYETGYLSLWENLITIAAVFGFYILRAKTWKNRKKHYYVKEDFVDKFAKLFFPI